MFIMFSYGTHENIMCNVVFLDQCSHSEQLNIVCWQSGAGGTITAMKFLPRDTSRVVTAAVDGTVTVQDFDCKKKDILLDTQCGYE